jgi:hemoglobin
MPNDAKELSVHVTEESIALLIDRFYVRIRQDPVLADVFEAAIAPDEWPEHLATMRRFWSSVMLTSGLYSANPVAVHRDVHGLARLMFVHWLALFDEIVSELFAPAISTQFATKAQRIAASLELVLFHKPGEASDSLRLPLPEAIVPLDRRAACD